MDSYANLNTIQNTNIDSNPYCHSYANVHANVVSDIYINSNDYTDTHTNRYA
jgi:hypothetical protein